MSKLDLRVGHPEFFREVYKFDSSQVKLKLGNLSSYEYTHGTERLKNAIVQFHLTHRQEYVDPEHLIIANGATELLRACFSIFPGQTIRHSAPYWNMLPSLARASGKAFVDDTRQSFGSTVEVGTIPGNPDGTLGSNRLVDVYGSNKAFDVWDAAYAWSWYLREGVLLPKVEAPVSIFTASKAVGLAGARVGWAIVPDKSLRNALYAYVELSSGGVGVPSQEYVANALTGFNGVMAAEARAILSSRWSKLEEVVNPDLWELRSKQGMFLLVKDRRGDLVEKFGATGISGSLMGLTSDVVRFNIGCSRDKFDRLAALFAEQ